MKPLLVYCPEPRDATSFYRGYGPLTELMDQVPGLQLKSPGQLNWTEVFASSGAFLQRPSTKTHLNICRLVKDCQKPVWLDWDDNLFEVPTDNLAFHLFHDVQENLYEMMKLADVITFSTQSILNDYVRRAKERGFEIQEKCRVVPNALHPTLPLAPRYSKNKIVLWRGAPTHMKDMIEYKDEIIAVAKAHPDWKWVFIGFYPWMLEDGMKDQIEFVPPLEIFDYFNAIKKINPSVVMVPLGFNIFNAGKSNIAWIEAAMSGAVSVVPMMPEWRKEGAYSYGGVSDFGETLSRVLSAPAEEREEFFLRTVKVIPRLAYVNSLRKDIIEEFFE